MLISANKSKHITGRFVEPYFIQTNSAGIIIAACEKFIRILSAHGIVEYQKNIFSIFSQIGEPAPEYSRNRLKTEFPKAFNLYIPSKNKTPAVIHWMASPARGGRKKGWQFTGMDMPAARPGGVKMPTQRPIPAEKEEDFPDTMLKSLPGIFYLLDDTGKYLRWNKRFESVSGYSAHEISNMKPGDFVPEEEKQYMNKRIEKVFSGGASHAEANLLTREGKKIPYYFTAYGVNFRGVQCLGGVGVDISELKKEMEKKLLQRETTRQKLIAAAVINAQEKERADIGKELHDNVNQILSTGKLYAELAKTNKKDRLTLLQSCSENINHAINEIRKISSALTPSGIGDLGLLDSIKDLVEHIKKTRKMDVAFYSDNWADEQIDNGQKLMLFRIIQEQVKNVIRHSGAKNLSIELKMDACENIIMLNIADDGMGFDPRRIKTKKSQGFSNISSRAALFDGTMSIISAPEKGCRLNVQIPIDRSLLNKIYE